MEGSSPFASGGGQRRKVLEKGSFLVSETCGSLQPQFDQVSYRWGFLRCRNPMVVAVRSKSAKNMVELGGCRGYLCFFAELYALSHHNLGNIRPPNWYECLPCRTSFPTVPSTHQWRKYGCLKLALWWVQNVINLERKKAVIVFWWRWCLDYKLILSAFILKHT